MMEAESKGFASVADMVEADKKAVEDKKQKEIDELREVVRSLILRVEKIA